VQVDEELIEARVREINDAIGMLGELISKEFEELTIYERLSIRYLVIQLVEAASSICLHILLNVFDERAEGFSECFMRLGAKGVISRDLAERLSSAARLRNLLVHRYWNIVDERVYESVKRGLRDFRDFISDVKRYLFGDPDPGARVEWEFRYREMTPLEKSRLLDRLRGRLGVLEDVLFAYAYGGFVDRRRFRDVDVAVWIRDPQRAFQYTVDLSARLEAELGIPVDVQVLNGAPLPFRYRVFTGGVLLFSRDEGLRAGVVDETVRNYLDLRKLAERSA